MVVSKNVTSWLKIFCAFGVLLGHTFYYSENSYLKAFVMLPPFGYFLGSVCVGIFLFLSGYGLTYSYINKKNYLSNFDKRLRSVFFPFFICSIIYQILSYLIKLRIPDQSLVIDSLIGGDTNVFLPFSWYVFLQIALYFAFYFSFRFINKLYIGEFFLTIMSLSILFLLRKLNFPSYWLVAIPSFLFGSYFAYLADRLSPKFENLIIVILIFFVISVLILDIDIPLLNYGLFSIVIISIINKSLGKNPPHFIRRLDGNYSYFIYLCQGYTVIYVDKVNTILYVIVCILGTFLLSYILDFVYRRIFDIARNQ